MKKLKVKLRRIDNIVIMKIVQQDESIRGNLLFNNDNKDFAIQSFNYPNIYDNKLYICGSNTKLDDKVTIKEFDSSHDAKECIKKAKACIKAYNNSLKEKEEAEKKDGRWIPEKGDRYFRIAKSAENGIHLGALSFMEDKFDEYEFLINNVFKTEEEGKRAVEIEKKKIELSKVFSKEEWLDHDIYKYVILYDIHNKNCPIGRESISVTDRIHFESKEKAREFFNFCGADDYEKYVLGVY